MRSKKMFWFVYKDKHIKLLQIDPNLCHQKIK